MVRATPDGRYVNTHRADRQRKLENMCSEHNLNLSSSSGSPRRKTSTFQHSSVRSLNMKATITTDTSMIEYGVLEVAYWHNGIIIDFDVITGVKTLNDLELVYQKAHMRWFGIVAASILN